MIIEEDDFIHRHGMIARSVREAVLRSGLKLYAKSGSSATVTTILLPDGISFQALKDVMVNTHAVLIGGAFDYLGNQVFRVGHMGENAREEKVYRTLKAIHHSLSALGVELKAPMHLIFAEEMEKLRS